METDAIIKQIYAQARQLGCCDLFKGTENFEALVSLFRSPQGIEFCINNHFPNTATFRLFKPLRPERHGIYIDAGNITLTNPDKAILIGRTTATVNCDTNDRRHEVILLHGAKAVVNASRWAVCFTKIEGGCVCIKNTSENAVIL